MVVVKIKNRSPILRGRTTGLCFKEVRTGSEKRGEGEGEGEGKGDLKRWRE